MHPVERAPGHAREGVDDRDRSVEGEFGDLRGGELAEGIPELDDAFIVFVAEGEGADAVVACAFDVVVDCGRVVQGYGFGDDLRLGGVAGVFGEDEGAEFLA